MVTWEIVNQVGKAMEIIKAREKQNVFVCKK